MGNKLPLDEKLEKGYQKYVEYCVKYKLEYGYHPRQDMVVDGVDGHRMYHFREFFDLVNRNKKFRERFIPRSPDPVPQPLPEDERDWSEVIRIAKELVDDVVTDKYHSDNDDEHYIYEAAMEAIYGKDFWDWWNKNVH